MHKCHTAPADSSRLSAGRCARLWLSTRNISFFLSHESNARADFRLLLACLALDGEKHEKNNNAAELSRAICKFDWLVITVGVTKASHERKILEKQEKSHRSATGTFLSSTVGNRLKRPTDDDDDSFSSCAYFLLSSSNFSSVLHRLLSAFCSSRSPNRELDL